jgi:hypothetical protein
MIMWKWFELYVSLFSPHPSISAIASSQQFMSYGTLCDQNFLLLRVGSKSTNVE